MKKRPRILLYDIETSPNLCFTWRLGKQYVGYENIYKEKKVTVICYKWLGESKIHALKMDLSKHSLTKKDDDADKEMLREFSNIYESADLAVGHNAKKFDVATIRARMIKHALPDLFPALIDDTYLATKGISFNSHKLDYLAQHLGLGKKADHPYNLWVEVMESSPRALIKTVDYCKQDVLLLERVYSKLLPYIKTKLNRAIITENSDLCPSCGENSLTRQGYKMTVGLAKRIQLKCTSCGKWSTGPSVTLKASKEYAR